MIPDSALQLAGFQLFRVDRHTELSGKTKGEGICYYINSGWFNDAAVILQHCSPHLGSFFINCKPFYFPCEFAFKNTVLYKMLTILFGRCEHSTSSQILCVEQTYPDSLVIVYGDFLPKKTSATNSPHTGNLLNARSERTTPLIIATPQ